VTRWGDESIYHLYAGQSHCQYAKKDIVYGVLSVAKSIFLDFPDRADRRLWIGDACPSMGNCPGHPLNSHSRKNQLDINYYTFGINSTQYRKNEPVTSIWHSFNPMTLDIKMFDWERNFQFMKRLLEIFPASRFITQEDILKHMRSKTNIDFLGNISVDTGTMYNHHTHMHIEIRS
jgi:hypothetical protein